MNTKKLFMLLAAVLLMSTNARAQIPEAEIQKADVNGDGNVDVADIVGVVDIMKNLGKPDGVYKYYLGVVTEEQTNNDDYLYSLIQNSSTTFTGLPSTLKLPSAESDNMYIVWIYESKMGRPTIYLNNWSVGWLYELPNHPEYDIMWTDKAKMYGDIDSECKIGWRSHRPKGENTGLSIQDGDTNGDGFVNQTDIQVVTEMIKLTDGIDKGEFGYQCYFGVTNKESVTEEDLNKSVLIKPTRITSEACSSNTWTAWVWPTSWGKPKSMISSLSNIEFVQVLNYGDLQVPEGYYGAWFQTGSSDTFTITWPETYYFYAGTTPYDLTNYTSLPKVNSVPSSGTVTANRKYIYFVMPANKQLASLYDSTFTYEYDLIESNVDINIYQTVGTVNGTLYYTITDK